LNPIHKVSPRATIFAAGVESASTARNSSSVLLTVKSPFVQKYFALPLQFHAHPCLCRTLHTPHRRCKSYQSAYSLCLCASLLIYAFASLCSSVPSLSFSLPRIAVAMKRYAFALHSRAARICSTPLLFFSTPRTALPSLFDTRPCISFALLIEASLIQAIYAYLRRCAALSS
jgi:hypothetical protein